MSNAENIMKNYLLEYLDKKFLYFINQSHVNYSFYNIASSYYSIMFERHIILEIALRDNNFIIRPSFGDYEKVFSFSIYDPNFDINKEVHKQLDYYWNPNGISKF